MDQVKSQGVKPTPVGKDGKPLDSVESYQAHWAQLMEDTNLKIQQIRGMITIANSPNPSSMTYDMSYAGSESNNLTLDYRGREEKGKPAKPVLGPMISTITLCHGRYAI
jgi:hypothetical protein